MKLLLETDKFFWGDYLDLHGDLCMTGKSDTDIQDSRGSYSVSATRYCATVADLREGLEAEGPRDSGTGETLCEEDRQLL